MVSQTNKTFRSLHKWIAIIIFAPMIFLVVTGIILQLRKPVEAIQPNIRFGVAQYQPTASLDMILEAVKAIPEMEVKGWNDIQLYDLRPKYGVVKVRNFAEMEAQIDAKTAQVLNVGQRWNDIVTLMHEGTTWGLRMNVFLWVSIVWLVLAFCGLYLIVLVTKGKLVAWKQRRSDASQMAANNIATLPPRRPRPRFSLLAFCYKYHYVLGMFVIVPWLIVITSGILLQVRYELPWVMPELQKGSEGAPTLQFTDALKKARFIPIAGIAEWKDVWRVYVYPSKGVVSIRAKNFWQIQFDANSGELLDLSVRRTDVLEDVHEGRWMGVNLWLFLPIHVLSVMLWILGVIMGFRSIVTTIKRRPVKQIMAEKVTK